MENVNELNREVLKVLRIKVANALQAVTDEMGVKFDLGNIRFSPSTFTAKMEGSLINATSKRISDYDMFKTVYNLPDLGTVITLGTKKYEVSGFKASARKNNVLIKQLGSSKEYVCSVDAIQRCMANVK